MNQLPIITAYEILTLRAQHRVAYVYPRRLEVRVDGCKTYRITRASLDTLKQSSNGKVN